jgi:hypothetical protein
MEIMMYMRSIVTGVLSGLCVASVPALSQAALIITVEDATVVEGGTASVNVRIRSDGNDVLQAFGFEFRIASGGATWLEFVNPQPDDQLSVPAYVFFGDSEKEVTGIPVGTVSGGAPLDTFIGSDITKDLSDMPVIAIRDLLVRLEVTANTTLPPSDGDLFTVSLIPDSNLDGSSFDFFGGDSSFFQSSFADVPVDIANSDFSGLVTVKSASAAAVPEPSSLLLFSGLGGLALFRCLRRRSQAAE